MFGVVLSVHVPKRMVDHVTCDTVSVRVGCCLGYVVCCMFLVCASSCMVSRGDIRRRRYTQTQYGDTQKREKRHNTKTAEAAAKRTAEAAAGAAAAAAGSDSMQRKQQKQQQK